MAPRLKINTKTNNEINIDTNIEPKIKLKRKCSYVLVVDLKERGVFITTTVKEVHSYQCAGSESAKSL